LVGFLRSVFVRVLLFSVWCVDLGDWEYLYSCVACAWEAFALVLETSCFCYHLLHFFFLWFHDRVKEYRCLIDY
jgi:hypothetical protein